MAGWGGGGKKHEIYVAAFGGHLFYDLFIQGWGGGHGPLGTPLDPLLVCMLCTKHPQGKNENRHGDTRVSYATYMNVDVYGRRIRIGPGLSASIGLVEGSGDSKTVVVERFI